MKRMGNLWLTLMLFAGLALGACREAGPDRPEQTGSENEGSDRFAFIFSGQTSVNTKLKLKPPILSDSSTATFKFKCTSAPCAFSCKRDSLGWKKCKSPKTYAALQDGAHKFKVKAVKNGVTDRTPAKWSWTIDTTAPDTNITAKPNSLSTTADPSFSFDGNEVPCTFECSLDSGGFSACPSPKNYIGLAEGGHNFSVRATDAAGNPDPTPADYAWTIDTIAPDTGIDSNPADPAASTDASFTFSCNETPCTFECQLDSSGFAACSSPKDYSGLGQGAHNFSVKAADLAGNPDLTPASYDWTVDTAAPDTSIASHPDSPSHSASPKFEFDCNESNCTFECQLDSGGFSACASPKDYSGLGNGSHNFQVQATDQADNLDPSPASYDWTISLANSVAAGSFHSCALISDGTVFCWGANVWGQLGDGSTANTRLVPVQVGGLSSIYVSKITAGGEHSCIKSNTGAVYCWGNNQYGQLGTGDTTYVLSNVPQVVPGLVALDVEAGTNHTCAVNSGGAALCWGANSYGGLGDGSTAYYRKSPTGVYNLSSGQLWISAGEYHSCALSSGGGVMCWGWNIYGQLGDGTTVQSNVPVQVSGLTSGVESISAGGYHTCAKLSTGGIKCWGWNDSGMVGDGTTVMFRSTPTPVDNLSSGAGSLAAGTYHTCVSTIDPLIKCWGLGSSGQLGNNNGASQFSPSTVVGISNNVYTVSSGQRHTCAVLNQGPVMCWGFNNNGQLGNNSTDSSFVPVIVSGF